MAATGQPELVKVHDFQDPELGKVCRMVCMLPPVKTRVKMPE